MSDKNDKSVFTTFEAANAHAAPSLKCASCHKDLKSFRNTPMDCYGCHKSDYDQTRNPNHAASGLGTTCESCHQPSAPSWGTAFNHNSVFPLVGVHATQPCVACHKNNVYQGTPPTCIGCHQSQYNATEPYGVKMFRAILVNRIMNLLMREPEPLAMTEIVALTFTNKAATEMKQRLRRELTKLAEQTDESLMALFRLRYQLSTQAVTDRASTALGHMEKSQIGTLHSFAAHLLRLHPLESGIDRRAALL